MADITVNYCRGIIQSVPQLLDSTELKSLVRPGMRVSVKPNLVMAKSAGSGATTHPEIVEGLIQYLKDLGVGDIEIIESSWIGDDTKRAFCVCGYDTISKKYGVPLHDLKDDGTIKVRAGDYSLEVCRKASETDFLINVPVLKAHCQTKLTCNLKNLKGCIPDKEKRRFHALGLHRPIALLNTAVKTHFCLVDGICGDLTFEEGGNPVTRNMLLAGRDPLLLDSYCAGLIGYEQDEIEYIRLAGEYGVGKLFGDDTRILELNADCKPEHISADGGIVRKLAKNISEDMACSACYSALISGLHRAGGIPRELRISIGQGFRGKPGQLGCGNCTSRHDRFVPGCPPKAVEVLKFLNTLK